MNLLRWAVCGAFGCALLAPMASYGQNVPFSTAICGAPLATTLSPSDCLAVIQGGVIKNATGLSPFLASNAALKAVVTTTAPPQATIYRTGFTTPGDGGSAIYTWNASSCSLNAGAGDDGSQVKPTTGTGCWIANLPESGIDVRVWGAVPGATNSATAFNAAQAALTAGNILNVGGGTYTINSSVVAKLGVRMICSPGSGLTQPAAANLTMLMDFSTGAAHGATVEFCTIDGNRANNTDSLSVFLLYIGAANDVRVTDSILQNSNGYPVDIANGLRFRILRNTITNYYFAGVSAIGTAGFDVYGYIQENTFMSGTGAHAIYVDKSDHVTIVNNKILGTLVTGMVVSTSGTTVTWISGPNFANITPGMFMEINNNGTEYFITAKASNTSMTLNSSAFAPISNKAAAAGSGDLINVYNSSYTLIAYNDINGGVAGGLTLSNFNGGADSKDNIIDSNFIANVGQMCIGVEAITTSSPVTVVDTTSVTNNRLTNCGLSIGANLGYNNAIAVIDFGSSTLLSTYVSNNAVRDNQGSPTTQYWLGLNGVAAGQVQVGPNTSKGTVFAGIANGISSVTLGAGFGTTASVSSIISQGSGGFVFTITSAGTGQSFGPLITVNTTASSPEQPPILLCMVIGGTGANPTITGENNSTAAQQVLVFQGTPVVALTYIISCK